MEIVFSALKGLIGLALAAILVMVAWGVYTALDSATSAYGGLAEAAVVEVHAEIRQSA